MAIIYLLLGIIIGASIMLLWMKNKSTQEQKNVSEQLAVLRSQLETERKNVDERIAVVKENALQQLEAERNMANSYATNSRSRLKRRTDSYKKRCAIWLRGCWMRVGRRWIRLIKKRLDALLAPLKERLEAFNQTVTNNSKENTANKQRLKTTFEEAMKRLHVEQELTIKAMRGDQERAVKELREQTERIGNDAASLTQALKGDSKMQGDWGEMILDKTLEDCGLIQGQQYFLQENYKDKDGNNFRPDAVIVFPNEERAVIDAKVSLTAYQAAIREENATERERYLKEHVSSIKKHVDELSAKNYEKLVPGCIGFVLMFVPYESGYSAALKTDPTILQYAYRKHIIILSPSNLLMALQLTHTMWQNFRMTKNVEEILHQSNELFDKFVTFAETFVKLGADIERLQQDFSRAKGQLNEGKGNIVRRLEGLKILGISPKKQIPESL